MKTEEELFSPDFEEAKKYGQTVTDLFFLFGYGTKEQVREKTANTGEEEKLVEVGRIPFALRVLGIPSGRIELRPTNIPHMIGFGQEKTDAEYRNMHDLTLQEMLEIPNMLSNPDMIFRSNTKPNSSIIVCREVQLRENPIVLAMKINIRSSIDAGSIIVSGYEKDNSPKAFFSNLYANGYCIYDGKRSNYFEGIKKETRDGSERSPMGPIPIRAVTCTIPDSFIIRDRLTAVNFYKRNNKELVAVFNRNINTRNPIVRNLEELGYKTLYPGMNSTDISSILGNCTAVACERELLSKFRSLQSLYPNIKKIGEATSFMPEPIFKYPMRPLSEITNEQKRAGRSR